MYVKLRYRQLNQYSGQGTQISQIYSMNSAYDPDQTAAGANNQPLTWDQWSQFYRRYQVMASSIHLRIITTAGSQRNGLVIYPSNSPTPAISPNNAIEQRYAKSYLISSTTQSGFFRVKHYCSVKKIEARTVSSLNYAALTGSGIEGSNPSAQKFWQIILYALDDETPIDAFMEVKIVYYTKFFEPSQPAPS